MENKLELIAVLKDVLNAKFPKSREEQEKLTKLYERKVLDLAIELEQLKRKKILGIF